MRKFNKPTRAFSDKKKPAFRAKPGSYKKNNESSESSEKDSYSSKPRFTKDKFNKSDSENKEKRPFGKDRFSKEKSSYEKKPFGYKKDGDHKPRFGPRKDGPKKNEDAEPKKLSYKEKRSFTQNKEYRKNKFPKEDSAEKKTAYRPYDKDKPSFKRNDKFKEKEGDDFKRKPFKKDDDASYTETKRVKHDEFEEGKSFSGGYKKEFVSGEKKRFDKRSAKKSAATKSTPVNADGLIRLNKYLSNAGIASRREADTLIKSGVVKVNGVPITEMGYKIKPGDTVTYGDAAVKSERKVYLLLNKPKDYITTVDDPQERKTVMELIAGACRERVYPVGRLDRNTTGLLLFTNDGELTKKLTHPKHEIKKVYHVSLNKGLRPEDFKAITEGVELEDGMVNADDLAFVGEGKKEIGIEIHSGRNRIIRRIFEHLDYEVLRLDRVTFAGLTKKDLPRGKYRFLTPKEISFLQMIG